MQRTAIFLDVASMDHAFRKHGTQVDYLGLRDYLAEGRSLVEAFVYLAISPHAPDHKKQFADFLQCNGFIVRSKVGKRQAGKRWTCNMDTDMAADVLHYAHHAKIDVVVIGSGHAAMLPICEEVRWSGVRCEVAGTKDYTPQVLVDAANGHIDLGIVIREHLEKKDVGGSEEASGIVPGLDGSASEL